MPDEVPTQPPPPPGPEPGTTAKSTSTGLPSNVAAAHRLHSIVGGIIFYIAEKHDNFVRFYAMQSIIFGRCLVSLLVRRSVVALRSLDSIPVIGLIPQYFLWLVCGVGYIAYSCWFSSSQSSKAFSGVRWEIPYIGPVARKQVEGSGA